MPLDLTRYNPTLGPTGQRIVNLVNKYYPKASELYVTSAYRPTEADGGTWSHHNGQIYNGSPTAAVDFGALDFGADGPRRMRDLAAWLVFHFGDLTVEMFHTTPFADDNGFNIRNQAPAGGIADHSDHIHYATSAALLDQMEARALAAWGEGSDSVPIDDDRTPITETLFGWDASDYDYSRGARPEHVHAAAREGIKFFTHKATEQSGGQVFEHAQYGPMMNAAKDAGIPFLGAYVVPRTPGVSIETQTQTAIDYVNRYTPWAMAHPGFFWQVDLEHWSNQNGVYDAVAPEHGYQMADLLKKRTGKPVVIYAPRWAYGDTLPHGYPLWSSNYSQSGAARPFREMYAGNDGDGWEPYSGQTPEIWQYASDATIGGQHTTDANAFRGTEDDFRARILGQEGGMDMTPAESYRLKVIFDNWDPTREDWIAAKGDPAVYDAAVDAGGARNGLKQSLDDLKARIDALQADVDAITVGGIDVDALAEAVAEKLANRLAE